MKDVPVNTLKEIIKVLQMSKNKLTCTTSLRKLVSLEILLVKISKIFSINLTRIATFSKIPEIL